MLSFGLDISAYEYNTFSSSDPGLTQVAIRIPRIPRGFLILAVLVGPVIGVVAHRLAARVERDRAQAQLDRRVAAAALVIERKLAADLEVLYALRPLFESGAPVPPERFMAAAAPILARHPSLEALEWIPRIAHDVRNAFEQRQRENGFDGYTIYERTEAGEFVAAGDREWYYPVALIAPIAGNERAIGFDLGSDTIRREAIDRAAVTGEIALTDPVTLVQGPASENGVLALLAVFEETSELGEAGEARLRGFVLAVFRLNELVLRAQNGPGGAPLSSIVFELIGGEGGFWAVRGSSDGSPSQSLFGMSAEQPIDAGGRRWHLVAFPTAAYMRSLQTRLPLLLGVIAPIAWELLVGLVFVVGKRTRDRLERRHSRLMTNILESLRDGIIVADTNGRILTANLAAAAVAGKEAKHIPPSAWSEAYGLFVPGTETLFPPDELPLARAIRGEATDGVEVLVRNPQVPEGTYVSVSGAPLLSGSGKVRGGVVVFRDITESKKAEEGMRRLSSAVEQTADSVLITDQRGTIEYVNSAFEATTGYSKAEVLGRNPNILKSGLQSPEYYRELWSTILRGEPFRGTTINRKKNGDLYYAEQTITGIKGRNGTITHFVSVLKDMTERRKLQEQEIEMDFAAKIQRELFPAAPPMLPGYDFAGAAFPAQATSGDYFDFIRISDDALAMVIADVTGHGIGPALVMAEVRAYLRSLFYATDDLVSIMTTINRFLVADLDERLFVTMILAKLEPASGRCTFVNSAHPCGYVVDRSGEVVTEMKSVCVPLGLFPELRQCAEHEFVLGEGDVAVLVTDGVVESESPQGEEFGARRLLEILRKHRLDPAQKIVERVYAEIREFAHGKKQMDDVTVLICKRLPAPDTS
jgi:PAS domain S-box-containing protein